MQSLVFMQHYCSHPCCHPLNFLTSSAHKRSNYTINTEVHWLHVFAVVQVRIRSGKHNDKLQKSVHPSIFLTASHTCDKVKGAVQWTFHHSVAGLESNMSNKSKLSLNNYEHSLMMAGKSAADTGSDLSGQNAAMAVATVFTLTLCVSFNLGSSQSVFQREVNEGGVLLHCLGLKTQISANL